MILKVLMGLAAVFGIIWTIEGEKDNAGHYYTGNDCRHNIGVLSF